MPTRKNPRAIANRKWPLIGDAAPILRKLIDALANQCQARVATR